MNGRPHALVGAVAPLGLLAAGIPGAEVAALSAIAAGAALGPDIDHPNSTITRAFPVGVHTGVKHLSKVARRGTSTGRDLRDAAWRKRHGHDPDHRALTHTAVSAAAFGVLTYWVAHLPGGATLLVFASGWACRRLIPVRPRLAVLALFGVLAVLAWVFAPAPLVVGFAAGAGWFSHIVADGCTKAGVPMAWPIPVKGKRWYRFRLLGSSLTSGHTFEWAVAAVVAAAFAAAPLIFL